MQSSLVDLKINTRVSKVNGKNMHSEFETCMAK